MAPTCISGWPEPKPQAWYYETCVSPINYLGRPISAPGAGWRHLPFSTRCRSAATPSGPSVRVDSICHTPSALPQRPQKGCSVGDGAQAAAARLCRCAGIAACARAHSSAGTRCSLKLWTRCAEACKTLHFIRTSRLGLAGAVVQGPLLSHLLRQPAFTHSSPLSLLLLGPKQAVWRRHAAPVPSASLSWTARRKPFWTAASIISTCRRAAFVMLGWCVDDRSPSCVG